MTKNPLLKSKVIQVYSAVFVCLFGFSGCKKELPIVVTSAPKANVGQLPPKPVQKPVSSALRLPPPPSVPANQFDFSSKKDPFKPVIIVKAIPAQSEDDKKSVKTALPLHSLDVNQFKLIGVIISGKQNQAMVTDTGGKGYVLKVGMTIGKNNGKIVSISSSGVDVLEQFKDENGRVRKENIKLTLPRKE